jgi:CRP-like cAMP-binding protein
MGVMSQRMHWLLNEVDRLTLHNATFRLVAYLLDLQAGNEGDPLIHFDVPKHVIASRLSVKPETLSRILKQLSDRELIRVQENNIELLDPDALQEIARIE